MPPVIRGSKPSTLQHTQSDSNLATATLTSPIHDRRVTFDQNRDESATSIPASHIFSHSWRSTFNRRQSLNQRRSHDADEEERDVYHDSRAATQREFHRRGSTLQSYYQHHPELLPQLPFTFRHGFKRWKLAGYIALIMFDACIMPIFLYYVLTFGGNVQGWITFAVITTIWGGPTYIEFAVRSLRLTKKENFFKPLGANKRWAFDITNWILVFTIAVVTTLLIVGAAPHIVFLRVLSMPAPAILFCLASPIFLISLYNARRWKAPFRISSTDKGEKVLPGIYYIAEDIVAVNAGGGRPFREGWAARYNASPLFRKMLRDQSWFWSIPGIIVAMACTAVICIHSVPKSVAYGIGWGVPFLWACIWATITVPLVRAVMRQERKSWEEDSLIMADVEKRSAPPADAPGPLIGKETESSTLRCSDHGRNDDVTNGHKSGTNNEDGEGASKPSEATTA